MPERRRPIADALWELAGWAAALAVLGWMLVLRLSGRGGVRPDFEEEGR